MTRSTAAPAAVPASPLTGTAATILTNLADLLGVERPDLTSFDARWNAFDDACEAFDDPPRFWEAMRKFDEAHDARISQ